MRNLHVTRYGLLFCLMMAVSPVGAAFAQSAFDDPGARTPSGTPGDLVAVRERTTGNVSLGSSSQVVVLVRNDATSPLTITDVGLYPSSNITAAVGENQCAASPVAPGEICAMTVTIQGLQVGNYRIEMLIRHDGRSRLLTATVDGAVEGSTDSSQVLSSDLEAFPQELDFGTLTASRSQLRPIVLRNIMSQPIEIKDVRVDAGGQSGFAVKHDCHRLETSAACVATVAWAPGQNGPATGVVVIEHSGPSGVTTIPLKGEFNPTDAAAARVFPQPVPGKGLLIASQELIDFGSGVEQASSITVSLVNIGDTALTLSALRMASRENGVRISANGCRAGMKLEPVEACPLTVTWEPVREGGILDDVQIAHTGARGVLVLPLRGSANRAVNKDSRAIMFDGNIDEADFMRGLAPLSVGDLTDGEGTAGASGAARRASRPADIRGALDGYAITSHSARRAIVSGPGGSRVVFDNEQTVIGGILWTVSVLPGAVEFASGENKVLLLFDRSLSPTGVSSGSGTVTSFSGTGGSASIPVADTVPVAAPVENSFGGAGAE